MTRKTRTLSMIQSTSGRQGEARGGLRRRARQTAQGIALAALLGVTGCGSLPQLGRSEPDPSLRLAGIFMNAGAPEAALRAADDTLARRPADTEALALRADALAAMCHGDEAQQAYLAAIARTPSAVAPRISLGRLLVRSNPAAAEGVFADVLAREPGNAIALNNLGITRDLQGRHEQAQASYRAALVADPRMSGASVNLGLSMVLAGDMHRAVQVLAPMASAPDAPPGVLENLGIALAGTGETIEARRMLSRVLPPDEVAQTLAQYRPLPGSVVARPNVPATQVLHSSSVIGLVTGPVTGLVAAPLAAPVAQSVVAPATLPIATPIQAVAARPVAAPVAAAPVAAMNVAALALPVAALPVAPERRAPEPAPQPVAAAQVVPDTAAPEVATPPAPIAVPIAVPVAVPIAPPAAAPPAALADRSAYVQLAAADTELGAMSEWRRLRQRHGVLLRDRGEVTVMAEVSGRTVWRLRTGPFRQNSEAEAFCAEVRASGGGCWTPKGG